MIKKILTILAVIAGFTSTSVGGYLLGTKLADILIGRFVKPRISKVTVWNGPIPTHPSQL